jgi:autotransporter-associated beta strand protein
MAPQPAVHEAAKRASSKPQLNGIFINNGGAVAGAFGGATHFFNNSTAGNTSTAGNATFINNGATVDGAQGGFMSVFGTAANGTFTNNGGTASGAQGGFTIVGVTAANGTFTNNGGTVAGAGGGFTSFTSIFVRSTAGNATLIANGGMGGGEGGAIFFEGRSTGSTARVEVFGNGNLDISAHDAFPRMTIGSIEGDGEVFLGANNLPVGNNNLSTNFSGVIQDGGQHGGVGGSLTKIGSGTLTLSGDNTYTGNTDVRGGVLQVDGSITSNTFVRHDGTLAGTGTINASVTNNRDAVRPGEALGVPGVLTVVHDYTQAEFATLMIQIAGANAGQFSVLDVLGTANLNGYLKPVLLNGFVPSVGETFTFLNYAAVDGTLSILNPNIANEPEHWEVSYFPTYAILTVAPGNFPAPDQGSTLLLLTFGLLGLVTYRRQLLRGQP